MSLLCDDSLSALISKGAIKGAKPLKAKSKEDSIQAASIDLRIGEIFIPGANDIDGYPDAKNEAVLEEGHTAVIRTEESLALPNEYAAICFPPSRVSFRGLLMTNPGHVDPGYTGELRFTVINMGKEPYTLRKGDPIATLLVLKLDKKPSNDWQMRNQSATTQTMRKRTLGEWLMRKPPNPVPNHLKSIKPVIDRLSVDFLNVTKRADQAVTRAETKIKWFIGLGTIAAPILLAATTWGLSKIPMESDKQIEKLESRIQVLEQKLDFESVKKRVETLELTAEKTGNTAHKNGSGKLR